MPLLDNPYLFFAIVLSVLLQIFLSGVHFDVGAVDIDIIDSPFHSPPFRNKQIIDAVEDFISSDNKTHVLNGDSSPDIESVEYNSNGTILLANFWLTSPFRDKPNNTRVNYGMYIDTDFDRTTGFGGIDYKVEISWKNQSKQWTKVLEKWSHRGETRVLDYQTIPYNQFSESNAGYVVLSSDLSAMYSPEKYKILFYAETQGTEGSYIMDFTDWVAIPSPEFAISSPQNFVTIRPGETKTIQLNLTAAPGYEVLASVSTDNLMVSGLNFIVDPPSFPMSSGKAAASLTVEAFPNVTSKQYMVPILASASFDFEPPGLPTSEGPVLILPTLSQKATDYYTLLIDIKEPYGPNEILNQIRGELDAIWRDNKS